jgi:hypothetical protein
MEHENIDITQLDSAGSGRTQVLYIRRPLIVLFLALVSIALALVCGLMLGSHFARAVTPPVLGVINITAIDGEGRTLVAAAKYDLSKFVFGSDGQGAIAITIDTDEILCSGLEP